MSESTRASSAGVQQGDATLLFQLPLQTSVLSRSVSKHLFVLLCFRELSSVFPPGAVVQCWLTLGLAATPQSRTVSVPGGFLQLMFTELG